MTLLLALLGAAHATTAHVCVRNDGAGTFQPTSLTFFADTYGSENDGSAIGPAAAMGPGGHECVSISGLRATNVDRPETAYSFRVSWVDADGTASSTSSLIILDVDKYVGQAGAHSYYLDPSSYIAVVNAAPVAPGTPTATWDGDAGACLVTVAAPAATPLDFGTYRLERTDDGGEWWEVDAWQHPDAYSRSDDTVTGAGDASYRVVAEDVHGARTEGPEGPCVGSDAADDGTDSGEPVDTGGAATDTGGDDGAGGDTDLPEDTEEDAELDSEESVDPGSDESADEDKSGGCATAAAPLSVWLWALCLAAWRGRRTEI